MDDIITLDYGSGGKKTSELIEDMLLPAFHNDELSKLSDGAILDGKLVFSTDSFVVDPLFFPGGDIGKLCICGTVNDLCMCGGIPKYISLGLIIEEGFSKNSLRKIVNSISSTAEKCGVKIVTGDTKVVERGRGDGIYINTAGIGHLKYPGLSPSNIKDGDSVIVSGTVGNHGTAVMLARSEFFSESNIISDCMPLVDISQAALKTGGVRVLRDPTRGGVATTLCEFVENSDFCIELDEKSIPIDPQVKGVCDMLGLEPLYCACEGRMLVISSPETENEILKNLQSTPGGEDAAVIGRISRVHPGWVVLKTALGGTRVINKLSGSQLPRIC